VSGGGPPAGVDDGTLPVVGRVRVGSDAGEDATDDDDEGARDDVFAALDRLFAEEGEHAVHSMITTTSMTPSTTARRRQ